MTRHSFLTSLDPRISNNIISTNFHEPFQSEFQNGHNIKIPQLNVTNCSRWTTGHGQSSILTLLDLSVASDTIGLFIFIEKFYGTLTYFTLFLMQLLTFFLFF